MSFEIRTKDDNIVTKKRKNIALFMAMLENEFSAAVLEGAAEGARDMDANLIVFPMGLIDGAYSDRIGNNFRYQYNVMESFLDSNSIDAAIVEYGTIVSSITEEQKKEFLAKMGKIPTVLLSEEADGFPSICSDNSAGLKEVINHLIDTHKCTKIGFVSGPKHNHDAQERLNVYKEVLTERGINCTDDWIVYGNFSVFSEKAVSDLLTAHPDIEAIVFANDHMALGAYQTIKDFGRKIGEDIFITGFDNIPSSVLAEPPLTTVMADTKKLSYKAMEVLCKDEPFPLRMYVETSMIERTSCGCKRSVERPVDGYSSGDASMLKSTTREKIEEAEKRKQFEVELGNILREMVFFQDSKLEWYASVMDILQKLEFGSGYIFLYDECVYHRNHTQWVQPEKINLMAFYNGNAKQMYETGENVILADDIFRCEAIKTDYRKDMVVTPLFFRENQYGYMVAESKSLFFQYAFQIASQISSTLELMRILVNQERTKKQLEYANASKSRFLANVSHEIRTPINAILGMNEMILRENQIPEIDEYALNVKNATKSLLAQVNDILDFSKIEAGKMTIVPAVYSLSALLYNAVSLILPRANEKNLDVRLIFDESLPSRYLGDDVRITQILLNLLTNAVKYTPKGYVEISVNGTRKRNTEELTFSVTDTGIGIKKEDIKHLFASFERIEEGRNRNIEGTGLGMSITNGLLELMDSTLKVDSVYNQGSTFSFTIAQKIIDDAPIGPNDYLNQKIKVKKYEQKFTAPDATILVVDDNSMNRVIVKNLLKLSTIKIEEADSGKACIEKIKNNQYDLILLDHSLGDMDGIETLKEMKKVKLFKTRNTPVIIFTANVLLGSENMYFKNGFAGYLSKPVDPEMLDRILLDHLPSEKLVFADEEAQQLAEEKKKEEEQQEEENIKDERELIMIIDVKDVTIKVAQRVFSEQYDTVCFNSGIKALEYLNECEHEISLILLDMSLEDVNPFSVLSQLQSNILTADIPVVMTSYDNSRDAEIKCFEHGASDFIIKPFIHEILKKRIRKILDLAHLQKHLEDEVREQTKISDEERHKVERLSIQTMTAMAAAIDAKDKYTNGHSTRVAKYSEMIAKRAGKSKKETKNIYYIGLLHDVGKIGIPDEIINKTSRLTDEEFAKIKEHPTIGMEILKDVDEIPDIAIGAHWHHERYDGKGYPDGLKGTEIPEFARIIGVADAYDAMTSSRSYRDIMSQEKVRSEIEKGIGTQFDPKFAEIMLEIIDEDKDFTLHE